MFNILTQNGKSAYGVCEYACDTGKDLENLPINCAIGSRALILETGQVFVLNRDKKWKIMGNGRLYGPEEIALILQDKEIEFAQKMQSYENQLKEV